jgi:hypothetical protein
MKMQPREIIKTCTTHYQTWKNEALKANNTEEMRKFMDKAFFWLELQNNLLILWTIETTMGNDPKVKEKLDKAELNVNRKITDYASQVLRDMK